MNMHNIFYWPGINQEIEKFVASCSICSAYQSVNKKELESLMMDLGHLRGKNYLVTVDYYSIFIEIDRLYQIIKQREVMHKLKAHMARHGIPMARNLGQSAFPIAGAKIFHACA
jgi:hypothetical protein